MKKNSIFVVSILLFSIGFSSCAKNGNSSEQLSYSSSEEETTSEIKEYRTDYYNNYYENISSWTNGDDLREKLVERLYDGYTALAYDGNWEVNQNADQALDDFECVNTIYDDQNRLKTETSYLSKGYQREHAFAKTLMVGENPNTTNKGMLTDFHNLFAANETANNSRSNKNFGEVSELEKTGEVFNCIYSADKFEPSNQDKGRLSRAIFYMALMYGDEDKGGLFVREETCRTGEKCMGNLSTLLNWNNSFDVDRKEYQHNEVVYSYLYNGVAQGNRNPFVDYPELVDYIFGSKANQPGELKYLEPSYEKLEINSSEISNVAIENAKRTYTEGEVLSFDDISLISVNKDFTTSSYDGNKIFSTGSNVYLLEEIGTFNLKILTLYNEIDFKFEVKDSVFDDCNFKHKFTAKSAGQDFADIATQCGVYHEMNFEGVDFLFYFEEGSVQSNSATQGVKFGTNSVPCKTIIIESKEEFTFDGKNQITDMLLLGDSSSQSTYDITMYVDDAVVYTDKMNYNAVSAQYGVSFDAPKQGKVKFVLSNITKSVYLDYIAIRVI
ncbi:MAG: endonuclease [Bacilli bacterium]